MQPDHLHTHTSPDKRLVALIGNNFSGRTFLLKNLNLLDSLSPSRERSFYIGPEVYNAISGLATTVRQELMLNHDHKHTDQRLNAVLEEFELSSILNRNPFTLSGGEQALLTLASAFVMEPGKLAVDCSLEQVGLDLKRRVIARMVNDQSSNTTVFLADNRLGEYGKIPHSLNLPLGSIKEELDRELQFDSIQLDFDLPLPVLPTTELELDRLQFNYTGHPRLLQDITIRLEPGEIYSLFGKNGAGKSTLAKLLSGVIRQRLGRLLAYGKEYQAWKRPGFLVGYHFQNPDVQLFSTTVEDEILAGLRYPSNTERSEHLERSLCIFGLDHVRREHPLDLPFVIRKRIALAATIAMGSPWIILDEPILSQDDHSAKEIAKLIMSLATQGRGMIIISHSKWFHSLLPSHHLFLENGFLLGG